MKETILLIDGSSFIFRAFHAMPNLTAPDGKPTGATYGIINMLKQMQKKYSNITLWGCVFDTPHKTFRDNLYPEYKANRAEMPTELVPQISDIHQIINALGIPIIIQNGIEADDIIGTIAVNAVNMGFKVLIATGDKDFAQLVNDNITLINTMNDELLDYNGVINKFGVEPSQIIDYLSLVGDKADNVPGVNKCGPKTAVKWLTEYKTLDNLLAHQDKISGVVGENLRQANAWLKTAKTLVTIDTNIALTSVLFDNNPLLDNNSSNSSNTPNHELSSDNLIDHLALKTPNQDKLYECYTKLGFKNWLKQLNTLDTLNTQSNTLINSSTHVQEKIDTSSVSTAISSITNEIKIINSMQELEKITSVILKNQNPIAIIIIPNHSLHPTYLRYMFIAQDKYTYVIDIIDPISFINNQLNTQNHTSNANTQTNVSHYNDQLTHNHIHEHDHNKIKTKTNTHTTHDLFNDTDNDYTDNYSNGANTNDDNNDYSNIENNFNHATSCVIEILNKILKSNIAKTVANYKDMLHLATLLNLKLNHVVGDLNLVHYIKNSRESHSISHIFKKYLNLDITNLPSINPKNSSLTQKQLDGDHNSIIENCIQIVTNLIQLETYMSNQLDAKELYLYKNIELPLAQILIKIETAGVTLDITKFKILETEISSRLYQLEQQIFHETKCVFNVNSTKQLQDILFNQLKLPTVGIKKNIGGYSTDEDTLNILATQNIPVANLLLEYRNLSKLLNTYINKLPKLVDKHNKIHTVFEQALVTSGRLSSHNPNLQNIPIKNDLGRRIRQCFIADPGHVLICADYSQIELRVLAHFSQDPNLINAFNHNQDIHSITASEIFHKPIVDITADERRHAKTINFSLLYGKTAYGLALELNIDRATAKKYIDTYFAKFPKVLQTLENIKQHARENKYVTTAFGRRIYLPNILSHNKIVRDAEERLALNAPMQGTSADIIKIAMCNLDSWLVDNKLKTSIILQVHDELILQVPMNEVEIVKANLGNLMTKCAKCTEIFTVNLAVNIKIAHNWDEAH